MNDNSDSARGKKNFYCLWIRTGSEEEYIKQMQPLLDDKESPLHGKLYCLGKQMRLKSGKEYIDSIFPGYIFLETERLENIYFLGSGKDFIGLLPQNKTAVPLCAADVDFISSILKYGTVIPIVPVQFDVNDRIEILDGPFKGKEALVTAVNRRNKRVNFEVTLMNGTRVLGLTYEVVRKI